MDLIFDKLQVTDCQVHTTLRLGKSTPDRLVLLSKLKRDIVTTFKILSIQSTHTNGVLYLTVFYEL